MQLFSKNPVTRILVVCALLLITFSFFAGLTQDGYTAEQVRQKESGSQLAAISDWVLAYADAHNGNWPHHLSELLSEEESHLRSVFFAPNRNNRHVPEFVLTNSVLLNQYADYAICTNSEALVVGFPYCGKVRVIAYENPGLWSDDTVAVFFEGLGVLRMKRSVFMDVLCKRTTELEYSKKTRLFEGRRQSEGDKVDSSLNKPILP